MSEDVSRLPVWARNRIRKLEADNTHLSNSLRECINAKPGDTDTVVQEYGSPDVGLPRGSRIRFGSVTPHIEVRVVSLLNGDFPIGDPATIIEVRTPDGELSLLPKASNSIYVRVPAYRR